MTVHTSIVRLVPIAPADLLALKVGPVVFKTHTGLTPGEGLGDFLTSGDVSPSFLERLHAGGDPDPWHYGFFLVPVGTNEVVGMVSFKGPPDEEGAVEVAYVVVPRAQGRGYATEGATALVDFALQSGRVRVVRAHTLSGNVASVRVLEKCGFACRGEVIDPEDGLVTRWELPLSPG